MSLSIAEESFASFNRPTKRGRDTLREAGRARAAGGAEVGAQDSTTQRCLTSKIQKLVRDKIWGKFFIIAKPVSRNPSCSWPSTMVLKESLRVCTSRSHCQGKCCHMSFLLETAKILRLEGLFDWFWVGLGFFFSMKGLWYFSSPANQASWLP